MIKIACCLTALAVFPMVALAGDSRVCNLPGKDYCSGIVASTQVVTTKPAANQAALELDTTSATNADSWTSLSHYERQMIRAAE